MTRKPRVLFVGAFQTPPGSTVRGGQLAACRAIIASPLSERVEWILLETVMESIPPPPVWRRARAAGLRCLKFLRHLITGSVDAALIFTGDGLSLLEKGTMALMARLFGKRVVLCPRSGYLLGEYRRRRFTRFWLRLVVRASDRVVCQGGSWREFFTSISGLPAARFPVIYNIVNHELYANLPLPARERAEQVLLMGWIETNKGVFDLLAVVDRFRAELQAVRFVICGHGREWDRFHAELKRRNLESFFELRGWVDHEGRCRALAGSDLCLMLSYNEGMPNALLESMAAGRPVIATNVGAVADIVVEGQNGFLSEPGDIDKIGARIIELCRDRSLRARMGAAARRAIQEKMDPAVVSLSWHEALRGEAMESSHR